MRKRDERGIKREKGEANILLHYVSMWELPQYDTDLKLCLTFFQYDFSTH